MKKLIFSSGIRKGCTFLQGDRKGRPYGLFFLFCLLPSALFGQVTIGKNAEPQPYSVLELYGQYESGSYGGLRLPQLTTPQRNALVLDADAPGLMIFNSTTECMEMWNGAKWISFCDNAGGITGNYVVINGVKWATSNLGVGGVFCANPEDYGALYQWGRLADGHERRTPLSDETSTLSGGDIPVDSRFITPSSSLYDWRSPQKDGLWNSGSETSPVKTANDPCPAGWRVPTRTELQSLETATRVWYNLNSVDGYLIGDGDKLFLPAAGGRNSDGTPDDVGTYGYYWSSTPSSTDAFTLSFSNGYFLTYNDYFRADGLSVRCVAEF